MNTSAKNYTLNEWLVFRGRYVNVTFMLKKGSREYLVTIRDGGIVDINPGPHVMPRWTFSLTAEDDTWNRFWASELQPRYHDLMAMVKFKTLRIEGDQTIFMSNLLYFKELVSNLGSHINAI